MMTVIIYPPVRGARGSGILMSPACLLRKDLIDKLRTEPKYYQRVSKTATLQS